MFGRTGRRIRLRGVGRRHGVAARRDGRLHRFEEPSGPSSRCLRLRRGLRLRGVVRSWWGWPWGIQSAAELFRKRLALSLAGRGL